MKTERPKYANVTFGIDLPLDNQEIMDIAVMIECELTKMGFRDPCIHHIAVGPTVPND